MVIEVKQVLHMKEGTHESSYAKSSYIQRQVLSLTKSVRLDAIRDFCTEGFLKVCSKTICVADLGCSSAELNTLGVVLELIEAMEGARRQLENEPRDYHVCLNDLPGNDFNTLFKSLAKFEEKIEREIMGKGENKMVGRCFVHGVPGSFYGRLFPSNSLHFVFSSYSLMWLSQVPKGIEENKGNIYIGNTSPASVVRAYVEQFEMDFTMFLRCRSEEVVGGGRMVLTFLGRETDEPYSKESCLVWEILATVLNEMVFEGLIEEEELKTFNIPQYLPSPTEVCKLIEREGSFVLNQVHVSRVYWQSGHNNNNGSSLSSSDDHEGDNCKDLVEDDDYYDIGKCMRSVAEPLLVSHFGEGLNIHEVFRRYGKIALAAMFQENVNVTVSITRKTH